MKPVYVFLTAALLAAQVAHGAQKIESGGSHYFVGPAPAWVHPLALPGPARRGDTAGQSVRYLLSDRQVRIGPDGDTVYRHSASQPLNEDGLARSANIKIVFNPEYQTLTIHAIDIVRNGRRIHKLRQSKIKLIQRETDIDRQLYDGAVTAFLALDDVRIGDVIEYSYSIRGTNPVFGDKYFASFTLGWSVPVERVSVRLLAPAGRKLHWRVYNIHLKPKVRRVNGYRELTWAVDHQPALTDDGDYPRWYQPYPWLQITEYRDWAEVARWARDLYRVKSGLHADLRAKVQAWKSLPAEEATADALHFVQQKVRYFGVELGQNSHRPHDPNEVYRNRYGDCKDKALLLSTLLKGLGVEAHPALVSTDFGKGIAHWLPSPGLFDHVIVMAEVNGRRYWLDPTRSYQDGPLDRIAYPKFGVALPVARSVKKLAPITGPQKATPSIDVRERITVASYDKPVHFTVKSIYTGREAEFQRYYFSNNTRAKIQRNYLNYYRRRLPGITALHPVRMRDDKADNRVVVEEAYQVPDFWTRRGDKLDFELDGSTLSPYTRLPRTMARTMPLALTYPIRIRHKTTLVFPRTINFHNKGRRNTIEDDAMVYTRIIAHHGRQLSVEHRYRSKRDAVMPSHLKRYFADLRAIRHDLSYSAWVGVPEQPSVLIGKLLQRLETYSR
jgi:transglutaminase-like putative cysteine protease